MKRTCCTALVLGASLFMISPAWAQREWRTDYTAAELLQGGAIISCTSTPLVTTSSGNSLIEDRENELKDENKKLEELLGWMEGYLPENQQALAQAFGLGQGDALSDLLIAFGHKSPLTTAQQRALRAQRRPLWDALAIEDGRARALAVHRIMHEVLNPTTDQPQTAAKSTRQAR